MAVVDARRRRPLRRVVPPGTQSTRDRILDAAETLFGQNGFAGTAMRDVAAAVGLNPASLYNYFSGKKGLYEAVLERGLRPVRELLDSLASSDWSPASLGAETEEFMRRMAERPQLPRLLLHESLTGGENLRRLTHNWLAPLFARALVTVRHSRTLRKWQEDELPLLLMAFHHLILGHFALTSLMQEVSGEDPLSPAAAERHVRFMRRVVQLLVFDEAVGTPEQTETLFAAS